LEAEVIQIPNLTVKQRDNLQMEEGIKSQNRDILLKKAMSAGS
jgi:hypothetical protein